MWYRVGLLLFKLIRWSDFDRSSNFAARLMRRIGPRLRGHRTARANLVAAYPDKSAAEIERILGDMWDNLGRLAVEYVNLDRLVDPANPNSGPDRGRAEHTGKTRAVARRRQAGRTLYLASRQL